MANLETRATRQAVQIPTERRVREVITEVRNASTKTEQAEVIGDYLINVGDFLIETSGEGKEVKINRRLQRYLLGRQAKLSSNR